MAVMITAEVKGQTQAGYDGMLPMLSGLLMSAPGFVLHTTHATDDGWRVIEVWSTKAEGDAFFAKHVAPQLPPGIRPKRSVQPLHNLMLPTSPLVV